MPVLRYGFGILKFTAAELWEIDRKVRKVQTKGRFHHPKSNLHRLYLSRQRGDRGLIGTVDCHRQECYVLSQYLSDSTDPLSLVIRKTEHSKKHGLISFLAAPKKGTTKLIDAEHEEGLSEMTLHGNDFKQQDTIPNINLLLSRRWTSIPYLRFETESILCAAQEQVLANN